VAGLFTNARWGAFVVSTGCEALRAFVDGVPLILTAPPLADGSKNGTKLIPILDASRHAA